LEKVLTKDGDPKSLRPALFLDPFRLPEVLLAETTAFQEPLANNAGHHALVEKAKEIPAQRCFQSLAEHTSTPGESLFQAYR
jgi:hypothetical protein